MIRSLAYGSLIGMLLLSFGCAPSGQQPEMVPSGGAEIPLWSMPLGCDGGIQLNDATVSVVGGDRYRTTLDMSTGRVLDRSDQPVDRLHLPADTQVKISGNSLRPLRASLVRSIAPAGFKPVVATDKYVFAKRTWWGLERQYLDHSGQMDVVDRSTRSVVWQLNGTNIVIQASPTHIVVCNYNRIAVFLPQASRPQEITDFYSAIRRGDVEKVARLFRARKRTPLYDYDGRDPLTLAAYEGKTAVVRRLLALNLSPNTKSADGYSPLLMALNWDNAEIVALLLGAGADPNYNAEWEYPLTRAAESGTQSTIEVLLKSGANLNAVDHLDGRTALHEAVMYRNYDGVQALLKAGADRAIKDHTGKTAAEMADRDDCISHLFAGGKISEKPVVCAPPRRESAAVAFIPRGLIE